MTSTTTIKSSNKRRIEPTNLILGAMVSIFEVTTLGQPLEVLKTHMAAHRNVNLKNSFKQIWFRGSYINLINHQNYHLNLNNYNNTILLRGGGIRGFYQGLVPWAWIESSSSGAILLFTSIEIEKILINQLNFSNQISSFIGGCGGGIAQAYMTMGVCTTMKTAEITRSKNLISINNNSISNKSKSTISLFFDILKNEGIGGINKGVHAVALRQCSNWGSRIGFSRLVEDSIRIMRGIPEGERLRATDKVMSSVVGGTLSCWNHPIEVVRIEMQSMANHSSRRPKKLTIVNTMSYIYREYGIRGLFKGVLPRMGLSVWRTVCLVSLSDMARVWWRDGV